MPLFFPDDHKPDLSISSIVELKCLDVETGQVVRVLVWDKATENHGLAIGHREPFIDANRDRVFLAVLDRIVAEASDTYDRLGRPRLFELRGKSCERSR